MVFICIVFDIKDVKWEKFIKNYMILKIIGMVLFLLVMSKLLGR